MENWLPVPGYEETYEVSDVGRVRRIKECGTGRRAGPIPRSLNPHFDRDGYKRIELRSNCKGRILLVHRLVLAAFVGPCPDGLQVNHKNGVRDDNRIQNLEYVTPSENNRHSYRILKKKHWKAKLTEEQAASIRRLLAEGHAIGALSSRFVVSRSTISLIKLGKIWRGAL